NLVRTFCTNSGSAHVVREKYEHYYSVNGHSLSQENNPNHLVNFAVLKTILLTDPVVSGQQFAQILGQMAMQLSGGKPMMQRIGDFRMGRRSKHSTFNDDLYDFEPTLKSATPGDVSLAVPAKILRHIWGSLKLLDTIVPGILHPSTIIYYPEIKTYANRPDFIDRQFAVRPGLYMVGDGAGTSRGITGAWASGIRAADGVLAAAR
ncbi:MAG: pyridine nucleotide-disulfide oxidoreductase, partial [Spirochaetota bacterium]